MDDEVLGLFASMIAFAVGLAAFALSAFVIGKSESPPIEYAMGSEIPEASNAASIIGSSGEMESEQPLLAEIPTDGIQPDAEENAGATFSKDAQADEFSIDTDVIAQAIPGAQLDSRQDGSTLILDFWGTGDDEEVQNAIAGSLQSSVYWFGAQSTYIMLCRSIWEEIVNSGKDKHITVNVWDANKEQLFFSVSDDSQDIFDITKQDG